MTYTYVLGTLDYIEYAQHLKLIDKERVANENESYKIRVYSDCYLLKNQ